MDADCCKELVNMSWFSAVDAALHPHWLMSARGWSLNPKAGMQTRGGTSWDKRPFDRPGKGTMIAASRL